MKPIHWFRHACLIAAAVMLPLAAHAQAGRPPSPLVIATPGGQLNTVLREIAQPFERENNVKIEWVSGAASTEIVAKIAASKANPDYDVAFLDDLSLRSGSDLGLWAKVDEQIVTNHRFLLPSAVQATRDGVGYGLFYGIMFYNPTEFKKSGWAAPTSWSDLLRPEFCGKANFFHPNISYGVHALIMLGGGVAKIDDGIEKLVAKRNCFPVLETSIAKFEEKLQLGSYIVGNIPNVRAVTLIQKGVPIQIVVPKEGTLIGAATVSAVLNPKQPERMAMAQRFMNFIISPPAQQTLMKTMYFSPTNSQVAMSEEMIKVGMVSTEGLKTMPAVQPELIVKNRQTWARNVDRAMAR